MFPKRYVERIHAMLPESEWNIFFEKVTKPLPKTIRIVKDFQSIPASWHLSPVAQVPNTFFITRDDQEEVPLGKTLEHFTGKFYVASLSSLLPPLVLNPESDDRVLDICAAPGSKSTFLAEMMENQGLLVVNEPSSSRSKKLVANLERMGILNTVLLQSDGTRLNQFFGQQFDKILLDAPCSSEGFARKDSKFFEKMWSEKKIFEAAKLQKKLICAAFEVLAPEGEMVYSTCTSAPEENEFVVQHLLEKYGDVTEILPINLRSFPLASPLIKGRHIRFSKDRGDESIPSRPGLFEFNGQKIHPEITKNVIRIWPHLETENWSSESFFLAKIRKKTPLRSLLPLIRGDNREKTCKRGFQHKRPRAISLLPKNRTAEVITYLHKKFGIPKEVFKKYSLIEKNSEIWLASQESAQFAVRNPHRRVGMPVLDKDKNITSVFALHFGVFAAKNVIELDEKQKYQWMRGLDLAFEKGLEYENSTEIFVKYGDFCLGHGKVMNEGKKLKNKLDRDLVF